MNQLNNFLMILSSPTRNIIWYGFIVVLVLTLSSSLFFYTTKKGQSTKNSFATSVLVALAFVFVICIGVVRDKLTDGFLFLSGVIEFIPCTFFSAFIMSKFIKWAWSSCMDNIVLSVLLGRALQGIGCCLVGCCQGVYAKWGIYSAVSETTVIPVQAFEFIALLSSWLLLHLYFKKHNYDTNGKAAAIGLIVFGLINFTTDIFTVTFSKLFFMTSMEGIFALINLFVGTFMLYFIERKQIQPCVSSL